MGDGERLGPRRSATRESERSAERAKRGELGASREQGCSRGWVGGGRSPPAPRSLQRVPPWAPPPPAPSRSCSSPGPPPASRSERSPAQRAPQWPPHRARSSAPDLPPGHACPKRPGGCQPLHGPLRGASGAPLGARTPTDGRSRRCPPRLDVMARTPDGRARR